MTRREIIDAQLYFYMSGGAGCLFVAHAANDPSKYEWRLEILQATIHKVDATIKTAMEDGGISTLSLLFPSILTAEHLVEFLKELGAASKYVGISQYEELLDAVCLGLRARISGLTSWVTGFGPFDFLPATRRAPHVELTMRINPRPHYNVVMKEAPSGVIHLADMDMKSMRQKKFLALWNGSFINTEKILGHKPDLRSAARTTFAIPKVIWERQ